MLPTINAQISHLSAKRTKVNAGKIGEKLWNEIYESLQSEIARFERALHPDYENKRLLKPGQSVAALAQLIEQHLGKMCQVSSGEFCLVDPCVDLLVEFVEGWLEGCIGGAEIWKRGGQSWA